MIMAKSDTLVVGIIALILGIVAIAVWNEWAIMSVLAIILGLIAMKGHGAGRVLGIIGFVLGLIAAILWTLGFFHLFVVHWF